MAVEQRIQLTPQGKIELEQEREQLRNVKRADLLERIQELSSDGDVSDNSEYEDVKEELVQLESRIREIENIINSAEIVERAKSDGSVVFGSVVTLVDDHGEEETWTIVGPQEANARLGRISNISPVGAALLGKRKKDKITVTAPGGQTVFRIKDVR
jgi:transcription elongation factor GreA